MAEYIIGENDSNRRVDRLIRHFLGDVPLSLIYSSIRKGHIKLNGKKTKAETKTSLGDVLYVEESLVLLKKEKFQVFQNCDLDIILKTDDILFLNKEKGCVTHGKNSVDEKVKKSFSNNSSLSFSIGPLHRLDKNTTGVLTFSQSLKGATSFSKALLEGNIERYYIGVNEGKLKSGLWKLDDSESEAKNEITYASLIEYSKKYNISLAFYKLITGKKHQIRKGAEHFGTPLFCDSSYGSKRKDYPTYFLHSVCLHFLKPIFDDIPSFILAPLPNDFLKVINLYFPNTSKDLSKIGIKPLIKLLIETIDVF